MYDPLDVAYRRLAAAILLRAGRDAASGDGQADRARRFLLASAWARFLADELDLTPAHLQLLAQGVTMAAFRKAHQWARQEAILDFYRVYPGAKPDVAGEALGLTRKQLGREVSALEAAGRIVRPRWGVVIVL